METVIRWLRDRQILVVIFSAIYFAAVVLLHEEVSKISVWLRDLLTLKLYNALITISVISLCLLLTIFLVSRIRQGEQKTLKLAYWCFTLLVAGISYNTLLVTNVEAIHFAQYAFLAIPIFALTMSYAETLIWVMLLGAIDEAYQYFIFKNWIYFDFNDVVLNVLGGCIGVVLLFTVCGKPESFTRRQRWKLLKSPPFLTVVGLAAVAMLLSASGLLQVYPGEDGSKALVLLSKVPPSQTFWITFKWGKSYHILTPVEGLALSAMLIGCYGLLDRGSHCSSSD